MTTLRNALATLLAVLAVPLTVACLLGLTARAWANTILVWLTEPRDGEGA